jgi:hypothetical protein
MPGRLHPQPGWMYHLSAYAPVIEALLHTLQRGQSSCSNWSCTSLSHLPITLHGLVWVPVWAKCQHTCLVQYECRCTGIEFCSYEWESNSSSHSVSIILRHMASCVVLCIMLISQIQSAVAQWLRYYATNRKVAGSIPDDVIRIFHWHKSFWSHCGPRVDLASERNEYQDNFVGVNATGA